MEDEDQLISWVKSITDKGIGKRRD